MDFACELMDLCRGTQEVEAVLSESGNKEDQRQTHLHDSRWRSNMKKKRYLNNCNNRG